MGAIEHYAKCTTTLLARRERHELFKEGERKDELLLVQAVRRYSYVVSLWLLNVYIDGAMKDRTERSLERGASSRVNGAKCHRKVNQLLLTNEAALEADS